MIRLALLLVALSLGCGASAPSETLSRTAYAVHRACPDGPTTPRCAEVADLLRAAIESAALADREPTPEHQIAAAAAAAALAARAAQLTGSQ